MQTAPRSSFWLVRRYYKRANFASLSLHSHARWRKIFFFASGVKVSQQFPWNNMQTSDSAPVSDLLLMGVKDTEFVMFCFVFSRDGSIYLMMMSFMKNTRISKFGSHHVLINRYWYANLNSSLLCAYHIFTSYSPNAQK